jgi:cytochrome P450
VVMEMNPMLSPAARDNPYPFHAMARRAQPVMYLPQPGIWNVFLYEDCRAILRDPKRFSSNRGPAAMANQEYGGRQPQPSMLNSDPPRHTQLRDLVNRAFTPRMVAALEPRIRAVTDELLTTVETTGRMDVIDDLAYPLPVIMIAEILGVPIEDREKFRRWSDIIAANLGQGLGPQEVEAPEESILQMSDYFAEIITQRRQAPREDLISALIAAEIGGEKLDLDDLIGFCVLLLVAGNETTTNLIGNGVRVLLEHPDSWQRLRDEPALWPSAIEEVLRYRPPVQMTGRTATEQVELRGKSIEKGQQVVVWLASANRDEAEFTDPDRFEIRREPNRHLSFGLGIHFCLGAPLARLESRIALQELTRRLPALRRKGEQPYEPLPGIIMHGVKHLELEFDRS